MRFSRLHLKLGGRGKGAYCKSWPRCPVLGSQLPQREAPQHFLGVFPRGSDTFLFLPLCKYYSRYNWSTICNHKSDYLASACVDTLLVLLKN